MMQGDLIEELERPKFGLETGPVQVDPVRNGQSQATVLYIAADSNIVLR